MKLLLLILLATLEVAALDNSVTVRNNYTGVLTNHAVWFGRWFAEGEIPGFCKPYVTPSDTGVRSAVNEWQCEVKNRWRDRPAQRVITGLRAGSPEWSNAAGLVSIVIVDDIATMITSSPHGLAVGDRLMITGASTDLDLLKDNFVVHEVVSATAVKFVARFVKNGTYMTNIIVRAALDPTNPSAIRYYSANHGFHKGEKVTIANVGGVSDANGTFTITTVTRNEFVVNAVVAGTYTGGGTATGPDNGSVQFALVALKTTIPGGGSTRVDFENSADPSSAGDAAATYAAGFDKDRMLAASWNANLIAKADVKAGATAELRTSARTMLTAWNGIQSYCGPRYWARGPVATWIILEYGCTGALTYDFGWKIRPGTTFRAAVTAVQTQIPVASVADISVGTVVYAWTTSYTAETMTVTGIFEATTTCNGVTIPLGPCITVTRATTGVAAPYASGHTLGVMQWEDATAPYKSLHPAFHLRFVNGWSGVGERIEVRNEYMSKNQNLWYGIDLETGSVPASRIRKATFKHVNSSSWKLDTWDGADPEFYCSGGLGSDPDNCATTGGGTRARRYLIDHNTAYLSYARVLPEYKLYPNRSGSLDIIAAGFSNGDKGAIAPPSLGGGTFNQQPAGPTSTASTALRGFDGAQEAYVLGDIQAMCLQNWSAGCYEINFGDSAPGGAGNTEAQRHVPYYYREDDGTTPRYVMPGFGTSEDLAFGRSISLYARPTWIAFAPSSDRVQGSDFDRRRTACDAAAPAIPPSNEGPTVSTGTRGWPCYFINTVGTDSWIIDYTHQNDWNEFAYLITADPRYLDSILNMASWNTGLEHNNPGRNIGRSWSQPETVNTAVRGQGGWTRAVLAAAVFAPNVPQFGAASPSVETYYWNEKLWDMAFAKEGLFGIIDGHFAHMYPYTTLYAGTCPTGAGSTIWVYTRCQIAQGYPNPLGIMGMPVVDACPAAETHYPWIDCTAGTYLVSSFWYYHHTIVQWSRAAGMGLPMFDYSRRRFANLAFGLFGSANWNPFMNDLYQSPIRRFGPFVQTIAEMFDGLHSTWSGTVGSRRAANWCHVIGAGCNGALDNTGYIPQWRADIASLSDLASTMTGTVDGCDVSAQTPGGCTWNHAWSWLQTNVHKQHLYPEITKFILVPRAEITALTCTPGGTSAVCTYIAPTEDACTSRLSTSAPTDTLDTNDTSDGGGTLARTAVFTGLSPETQYHLRVTCGQRVGGRAAGTGRTSTGFRSLTEGASTNMEISLGAVAGVSDVVVTYGNSPILGSSLQSIPCASGCSPRIPAIENMLLYYRVTYLNASGTMVAQGGITPVLPR